MMTAIYIILSILILLLVLYLLVFIRPNAKIPQDKRLLCNYAHRGLWNENFPENSIPAFQNAVDNGYGIELDVQLSRDGEVVIFHDYSLLRMTGCDKKVCELSLEELKQLNLKETNQKIPTFKEVLALVDGKVPILVELKGETLDTSLCPKVAGILKTYKGPYCIESFNPLLIKAMRKFLPEVFYGQLYTNVRRDKKKYSPLNILLTLMIFNFLAKPNFIAYNKLDRKNFAVKLTTSVYKAPKFVWTAETNEEIGSAKTLGEYPIFELK
ncbi:MAG: glycerophosphodiester phosphodiesterase [Ruminococcaceae bacterium]|nr:glycerophosphodiester phosphodiesterase [Oscillospiraceae bacterium]